MSSVSVSRYSLELIADDEIIVIYGAGMYGRYIAEQLINTERRIYGFCDESEAKIGTEYCGFQIYSLNELLIANCNFTFVLAVANVEEKRVITRRLINRGIKKEKVIVPLPRVKEAFYDENLLYYDDYMQAVILKQLALYKDSGKKVSSFFLSNEMYRIVLVGNEEISRLIRNELKEDVFNVRCISYKEISELKCNEADAVVVTNPSGINYLEEEILKYIDVVIVNVLEVIR